MNKSVLTTGGIEAILTNQPIEDPVFQVLLFKVIPAANAQNPTRYRLIISDGVHSYKSAMLATQLNPMIDNNEITQNCVIKLKKHLCSTVQNSKQVVVLLEIEVLHSGAEVGNKLGLPVVYPGEGAPTAPAGGGAPAAGHVAPRGPPPSTNNQANAPPRGQVNGGSSHTPTHAGGSFYNTGGAGSRAASNMQHSRYPTTPGGSQVRIHAIESLSPYQNRWTICARVSAKSNIRTWSNSRGEGKLFTVNLLDESGEIRATLFKDQVDRFYDLLQVNQVYYISRGQLKQADKRYSSLNNDYEMTFTNDTKVEPCEDKTNLPSVTFNFVKISELDSKEANSIVDVIGVVKDTNDLSTVVSRNTQKEITKRDLSIVDEGGVSIGLTLWGNDAEAFTHADNPVVAVKGVRLSDWQGRSLSCLNSSQLLVNPDVPEAHTLRGWYDSEGAQRDFDQFKSTGGSAGETAWTCLGQAKDQQASSDKADYFSVTATVSSLKKDNCMYQACPGEGCNKKVVDLNNGQYRCEKCNREYKDFNWRMILQINITDFSGEQWITCFQESAETILGMKADELGRLRESEDEFSDVFEKAMFKKYNFKLRSRIEEYNEETRRKVTCVEVSSIDSSQHIDKLVSFIHKL